MKSLNIYFVSACITNINTVMFGWGLNINISLHKKLGRS